MENKQKKKTEKGIDEEQALVNPNIPVTAEELKKIKRKHLIIEIVLGVVAAILIVLMVLILVFVKKK